MIKLSFARLRAALIGAALLASVPSLVSQTAQPVRLYRAVGPTMAAAHALQSARMLSKAETEAENAPTTALDRASFAAAATVGRGDRVAMAVNDNEEVTGTVNLVSRDNGILRVSGSLDGDPQSTFSVNVGDTDVSGVIVRTAKGLASRIEQTEQGELVVRELKASAVLCEKLPQADAAGVADVAAATSTGTTAVAGAVPVLNSRPDAVATVYLDFDGEVVTDSSWNGGRTINAASYNFSSTTIQTIFDRVKEDYWPFNINITTDVNRYNSAPVGRRMRCIITPTDTAAAGSGGVAYVDSFSQAGRNFSSTIPCWVFNSSVVGVSEAISHEVGHTLGLSHDGRQLPSGHEEYFEGQGDSITGWAPIMGASYYKPVTQWSRGEYQYANNTENDVAIIASSTNGFGYMADEAGGTTSGAAVLATSGGNVSVRGVITSASDGDMYSFTTSGGTISLSVIDDASAPNLDVKATVLDSVGNAVAVFDDPAGVGATVSTVLGAGTFYLRVEGEGANSAYTNGYSNYGSIGGYLISGTIPGGVVTINPPTVQTLAATSVNTTSATLNAQITNTGGAAVDSYYFEYGTTSTAFDHYVSSNLISVSGASFSTALTGLTPGQTYYVRALAHNASATDLGRGAGWGSGATVSFTTPATTATATLTVVANPSTGGTVSGGGTYAVGSIQTISAAANTGYSFTNWNDGDTNATRTVTVPSGGATYTATFAQKTNDDFAFAQKITGGNGAVDGDNTTATTEPGEPAHAGTNTGASLWYSWIAPADGTVTFDTLQANFDTVLAVYTGNSVDALTPVASNDDYGSSYQSRVSFSATAGVTYKIAVAGWQGASGPFTLRWAQASSSAYTVSVSAGYGGSASGGGSYSAGATATINATPGRRYRFISWTENGATVSYNATYSFTVNSNRTLVANFRRR